MTVEASVAEIHDENEFLKVSLFYYSLIREMRGKMKKVLDIFRCFFRVFLKLSLFD